VPGWDGRNDHPPTTANPSAAREWTPLAPVLLWADAVRADIPREVRQAVAEQPLFCPFCSVNAERIVVQNELALAFYDAFPVTPGHILVIPRRHTADYFELSPEEQTAVWELVNQVRERPGTDSRPDGYNLGVNAGPAAGQTVEHTHVHVIPRRNGDQEDPRGGVRWIFPERAQYWQDRLPGEQQSGTDEE
jgi:diadenosine tetraphosphate (Ap4A) HIT family hydrolase